MARLSFFTLVLTAVVAHLSLTAVPSAHALQGMNLNPPPMVRRAEHLHLNKRMIKKKRAEDVPVNPIAAPTATSDAAVPPASTTSTPSNQPPSTTQASTRSSTTTSGAPGTTGTTTTTSGTTTSTSTSSSSSTQSSASSSTSSTSTTTSQTSTSPRTQSTVLVTQTAPPSQSSDVSQDQTASFLPHSVIIGLIVTGSCIAAGAAIWTIIRKWKFSPSRHFEDRLEPINWEPTQASGLAHDPTVAALERASSRNGGGTSRGSLGSNDEHGQRNMTSINHDQISMTPDFPPPHDFTAGAGGAYGQGAGYVDMHRGPSPAPGAYGGHYETPNPYDAYDYNNQAAYGQRRY